MSKEERELSEQAERQLRLAKIALAAGFISSSAIVLSGGHPAAGIALFVGCAAGSVALAKRARRALILARQRQETRQALEALEGDSNVDSAAEYCGEEQELLEQAGIELTRPAGQLGGRVVHLFAIQDGRVYEYEGLASEREVEQEGLVINTLLYLPATAERSALAMSDRKD